MRYARVMIVVMCAVCMCLSASYSLALQVGDKAPDFTLPATTAEEIKLADYVGQKPLVLFFYIGAFTKG